MNSDTMYIYIYIYIYIYTHTHIHPHTYLSHDHSYTFVFFILKIIYIYMRACVCMHVYRGLMWLKSPNIWYIHNFSRDVVLPVFSQLGFIFLTYLTVQNSCHYPPLSQHIPNTMSVKYSSPVFYFMLLVYINVTVSKWENSSGFKVGRLNLTWILFKCSFCTAQ